MVATYYVSCFWKFLCANKWTYLQCLLPKLKLKLQFKVVFTTKVFVLSTLFFYVYSWCNEIERKTVFLISGSRNYYLGLRMQLWNCKRGGLKLRSYFLLQLAHFWSFLQLMVSLLQSTNDTVNIFSYIKWVKELLFRPYAVPIIKL